MILTTLLLLLVCHKSQQNLILNPPLTSANLKALSTFTSETNIFKGLPRLPTLNKTIGEIRSVYYYDQLVAILDIAKGKKLLRCELVEV
jgi:hypothetical protein